MKTDRSFQIIEPRILLMAYAQGIFPMAMPEDDAIGWFAPDPRGIIPIVETTCSRPGEALFHVSRSLARRVRSRRFEVRSNSCFETVMRSCAQLRPGQDQESTWINDVIIRSYVMLHQMGHAHSVEAWRDEELVGGLYGVSLGGAFFGESMFSRPESGGTDSSKVCLVALVQHLCRRGFLLLDTQFTTPHLERFGAIDLEVGDYLARLTDAIAIDDVSWGEWSFDPSLVVDGQPHRAVTDS